MLLAGIILASPLCLMPAKDTVEELFLGQERQMTRGENLLCTFTLVLVSFFAAVVIPNIGDAMTVIGATSNPTVGFCLPIFFWLKTDNSPALSPQRLVAYFVNVFVIALGLTSLVQFIIAKINQ